MANTGSLPTAGQLNAALNAKPAKGKGGSGGKTGTGSKAGTGSTAVSLSTGLTAIRKDSGTVLLALAGATAFHRYAKAKGAEWASVKVPLWDERIDTRLVAGAAALALTQIAPKVAGKHNRKLFTVGTGLLLSWGLDWISGKADEMGAQSPAAPAAAPAVAPPVNGIEVGATRRSAAVTDKLDQLRQMRQRQLAASADLAAETQEVGAYAAA